MTLHTVMQHKITCNIVLNAQVHVRKNESHGYMYFMFFPRQFQAKAQVSNFIVTLHPVNVGLLTT